MGPDNDIGQTVGLTDSVAVEPPAGIYALASAPVVISKKSIAAVALTAALVGVSALVATSGNGGGEVTINQNNGTFENTMAPTVSPTTATPTLNPTTATPSLSPTLSPTIAPNVTPTSLPTLSPSANPTLSPTSPSPTTLSPSYAPTLEPTVDVSSESYVDNCTQDIYMFIDISPSIGPKKEAMQEEFAQTAIRRVFEYTQGAYHQVRVAVSSFAKKVYPIVHLDDDIATSPEDLTQAVQNLGQVRYTAHTEVFNTVTLLSQNRPLRASFNATTGRGLSVILITDGEPKIPNLSDAKSKVASQDAYLAMKQVFQDVKVWCFYPGQLSDPAYFESICNGFWQTEESLDDAQRSNVEAQTTTMSKIAASKICESVLVEEEEQESQRFRHVAP